MTNELIAGLAYFVFVFLKAFQQRNVAFMQYKMVMPISYAMATAEVLVFSLVAIEAADTGLSWELLWFPLTIGTGGGLGAVLSMWVHHRYFTHARFK